MYCKNLSLAKKHKLKAQAQQGMSLLRQQGRLRKFTRRSKPNQEEFRDWEEYKKQNRDNSEFLELAKPTIVKQINENERVEKEKRKKETEENELYKRKWVLGEKGSRRTAQEQREYQVLEQIIHESHMKGMKEADMETLKAIGWESLSGELEYWYDYRKLVTTECPKEFGNLRGKISTEYRKQFPKFPKGHKNYVEDDGGCPGLKANVEWVKNEEKMKMKEKQESQIKVSNKVTSGSNEDG